MKVDKKKADDPFSYYCTDKFAKQYHIADGKTDLTLTDRELVVLDHMLWAERTKVRTDEDYLFIMDLDTKIWKAHNKIWGVNNDQVIN